MSNTPLKNEWLDLLNNKIERSREYTDVSELQKGDYVSLPATSRRAAYEGQVVSIGPKNVVVKMPYGGWGDDDFKQLMEIKFPKNEIARFYKLKT